MTAARGRVALATYARLPDLAPDDRLLLPALAALGIEAEPATWDDGATRWGAFDVVVVRSCWDYHLRMDEFLAWLAALERLGVAVLNPPRLLRWNADKRYLGELAARGVPIVPTRMVPRGDPARLIDLIGELGATDVVVKPAISASAHATWRTSRAVGEDDERRFGALVAAGDVLVQPLIPEVARAGEWSLICFGGEPSHAVLKRPAPGDWRVQGELGGTAEAHPAPAAVLEGARRVLAAAGAERSTYARVDGYLADGEHVLMELELIEPQLFLAVDSPAAGRFARAIDAALR